MDKIKQILMERDGLTADEADRLIAEAREAMFDALECGDLEAADSVSEDYFQLDNDYLKKLCSKL